MIAFALGLAVAPAMAARTAPMPVAVPEGTFPPASQGVGITAPPCDLGQPGSTGAYEWFLPSDDYYYTLIDPADCGCPGGVTDFIANWNLYWPTPCEIVVDVWVIPAVDTGNGCYFPDHPVAPPDPTRILCGPATSVVLDGSAGGLITHSVPLPACACLANGQKAFVVFKFVSSAGCPIVNNYIVKSPTIVVDQSPDLCVSYNGFAGFVPIEMVAEYDFPGNPAMWVTPQACCGVTNARPNTWGRLKTLYR